MTAREYATENFAKVLRFMYIVPPLIKDVLSTWISVPKKRISESIFAQWKEVCVIRGATYEGDRRKRNTRALQNIENWSTTC